ncbi:MAG: hypothetical protein KGL39_25710 [Patescibacteria group bacterium]|nr:hypothetical protein [Patescibacteria group bacterium]
MPAPIVAAFVTYFKNDLEITLWTEEIPRTDTAGNPINPQATAIVPQVWPAVQLLMDNGFNRQNTFLRAYSDDSEAWKFQVWGSTKAQADATMGAIEDALVDPANWFSFGSAIGLLLPPPFFIYDLELSKWTSREQANERLAGSQLLWLDEMDFRLKIHGEINSTG